METTYRWGVVAALAPVAWGANYFVTHEFLPAGAPWWGAALRALPAGLLLLALCRERPRGDWWWKSAVLGLLNTSAFFLLVYLASHLLTTGTAATLMALSAPTLMLSAWALLAERPRVRAAAGAVVGLAGVVLMLSGQVTAPGISGLLASAGALTVSSIGYALSKRWGTGPGVLPTTAWQLTFGGLLLVVAAAVLEGAPPQLTPEGVAALGYTAVIATALAFVAWFTGLRRLPAATVGLIGLLNPVTGVLLGTTLGGESLTLRQGAGMALVLAGIVLGRPAAGADEPDGPPTTEAAAADRPHGVGARARREGAAAPGYGQGGETRGWNGGGRCSAASPRRTARSSWPSSAP
ncbi:DMT family transporter [Streptomyces sp. Q6]|uniref:DMT family transporter n=1 Tax=Streptomyces citrinus TaxID=3118173 RepID=A0ACD5AM41_9ACTN